MKVLIASTGFTDRESIVRNFALDQACALKKLGVDVRIVCTDLRTVVHSKHIGKIETTACGIPVYAYAMPCRLLSETGKASVGNKLFLKLYKQLEAEGWTPDIIHAHFVAGEMISTVEYSKCPFVLTEHFSGMNTLTPDREIFDINMRAYELADCRITVSSAFKETLEKTTGLSFELIPNVLDGKVFDGATGEPVEHKKIKLVSAGNLMEKKNFSQLIDAFAFLSIPDAELHIFGDGAEYARLKAQTEKLGLSDRVFLRGKVDREKLKEEYLSSDAFVLLSKKETFGVAYIEAMACGLPVMSANCGGTRDFITDENGIIVEAEETEEVSKALEAFILGLDRYNRQEIAAETVRSFGYENVMKRVIEIYKGLLDNEQ